MELPLAVSSMGCWKLPIDFDVFLLKARFSSRIFNTKKENSQVIMVVSTLKLSNDLDDLGVSTSEATPILVCLQINHPQAIIDGSFKGPIKYKREIFHCHVWLPEGTGTDRNCYSIVKRRNNRGFCSTLFPDKPISTGYVGYACIRVRVRGICMYT
jgi:hypothetical protein